MTPRYSGGVLPLGRFELYRPRARFRFSQRYLRTGAREIWVGPFRIIVWGHD